MAVSINTKGDLERRSKCTTTHDQGRILPLKKISRIKRNWGPKKLRKRFK